MNNVLVFPGSFRRALDAESSLNSEEMKLPDARTPAACVAEPNPEYILPDRLVSTVAPRIAAAVSLAAGSTTQNQ